MFNQNAYGYGFNATVPQSAYYNVPGGYQAANGYGMPMAYPEPATSSRVESPPRSSSKHRNSKISTDTSSKDPTALASRIFIGNVSTSTTRDEIIDTCRPFGRLRAVSLFKGFSFVQYSAPEEAALAVQALESYTLNGSKLDVRAVSVAAVKGSVLNSGQVKRPKTDFFFGGVKVRPDVVNGRNRSFAEDISPSLKTLQFHDHQQKDTLICGSCRSTFTDIVDYIRHRRQPNCLYFEKEVCPKTMSCFTCNAEFKDPWIFTQHLIHRHSINLFKGQPKSDPIQFEAKYGQFEQAPAESDDSDSEEKTNNDQSEYENGNGEPSAKKQRQWTEAFNDFREVREMDGRARSSRSPSPPHRPVEPLDFVKAFRDTSRPMQNTNPAPEPAFHLPQNPIKLASANSSALTDEEQLRMLAEFDSSGF
ncbi:unnamed protein product [Bursaphelenchus okinawaensis]|uniref:RRM domain-containing protein n=1 Tax=Bursaphelenchus okinawaensis TaxID=465554 RepID=A0A811LLN3_9BILA|nr:unnamed protein product [Bursaphelenchus okinawaensis]CAG9125930.1 unnamed protein product [Bursaphelenchus okinawaensis]